MKRLGFLIALIMLLPAASVFGQLRNVENEAFQRGEKMKFKVYYTSMLTGNVTAGHATFELRDENRIIGGRNTYHAVAVGKTKGAFNWFFRVVDRYESYFDEEAIVPWVFVRRVNEGGYKINEDVTFNQFKNTMTSTKRTASIPPNVQDVVSIFYYARTLKLEDFDENKEMSIDFFIDDSSYVTKIKFMGREVVETETGTYRCLKFKPSVAQGSVFDEEYPMMLWVTDDKNRLPVLAESEVIVGKVRLELIKYSGLRNPMTARIKD